MSDNLSDQGSSVKGPLRFGEGLVTARRMNAVRGLGRIFVRAATLVAVAGCGASSSPTTEVAPPDGVGFPTECARRGRVFFFSVGEAQDANVMAARYREHYGLIGDVLGTVPVSATSASDPLAAVREVHGALAGSLGLLVGVTDEPLPAGGVFVEDGAVGLYSSHGETDDADAAQQTVRAFKGLTHLLGTLYCGFAPNRNPRSVMYDGIGGQADLDRLSEAVWE